jgi:hypothetical protein
LNRHRSAHHSARQRDRLISAHAIGDSLGEPLEVLIRLFACLWPGFNKDKSATAVGPRATSSILR